MSTLASMLIPDTFAEVGMLSNTKCQGMLIYSQLSPVIYTKQMGIKRKGESGQVAIHDGGEVPIPSACCS